MLCCRQLSPHILTSFALFCQTGLSLLKTVALRMQCKPVELADMMLYGKAPQSLSLPVCHAHPDVSEHYAALRYAAAQCFAQAPCDGGWLHLHSKHVTIDDLHDERLGCQQHNSSSPAQSTQPKQLTRRQLLLSGKLCSLKPLQLITNSLQFWQVDLA